MYEAYRLAQRQRRDERAHCLVGLWTQSLFRSLRQDCATLNHYPGSPGAIFGAFRYHEIGEVLKSTRWSDSAKRLGSCLWKLTELAELSISFGDTFCIVSTQLEIMQLLGWVQMSFEKEYNPIDLQ
eukprot:645564-Rhodomonas_salina.1